MNTLSKSRLSKILVSMLGTLALSGVVHAQNTAPSSSMSSMGSMGGMHGNMSGKGGMMGMHHTMQGMHMMPATVTSVDAKTGMVEVNAEGMSLKLHFPTASVADLKKDAKITVHMGFSKP